MNDRYNKTSICSIVFLDIIEYSKKRDSEQIEVKNQFNALINHALKDLAESDRIILDTGDGAAIACQGSPEDVLFISLTIRDEILKSNIHNATSLYVRFGINLGPVRVVKDINGRPNIVGDGINVAQRIMSFAKPNQILVSRSYYEVTSRLTQEISQMFDYSGIKHDKHVREHEVYSVRLLKGQADEQVAAKIPADYLPLIRAAWYRAANPKYAMLALVVFAVFVVLVKQASLSTEPVISTAEAAVKEKNAEFISDPKLQRNLNKGNAAQAQAKPIQSKVSGDKKQASTEANTDRGQEINDKKQAKSNDGTFKSSVKRGGETQCSPAQIAMNQCS